MKKILFAVFISGIGIFAINTAYAKKAVENASLNAEIGSATQEIIQKAKRNSGWDWLNRTDFSFEMMDLSKPTWSLETIQPIYQTPDSLSNTYFFQGRWAYKGMDNTFNFGLGYRHLLDNQSWIFGVNGFYDLKGKYAHQRIGAGAEAIGKYITLRSNYYHGITGRKDTETIDGISYKEKALNGYDAEIDAPVPFLPWIRVAANYFRFKSATSGINDITGNILTIRSNLTKYLSLELGRKNDTLQFSQKFIMLTLNLMGNPVNGVQGTMTDGIFKSIAFEGRDLREHTLDKVQRNNDIVVERTGTGSSGSNGIIIGRRN
ncbi:MAG: inverse autotransporter beta domain-containing protein [Gammaproteobacteria bacterium]|nr:inverse autotransporter beta domain-containing protein [Gammaproteobacteria bacterium]